MDSQSKKHSDSIEYAGSIGYSEQEIRSVPADAAVTHGCGNPTAIAGLKEGQIVLDLGCGCGLDVFLATQRVGPQGRVFGVDHSPEMIKKARNTAQKNNFKNVEFILAEMENLPLSDNSVDVAISNCVINHSPDKLVVFREVCRVLKPGGEMYVSDLVITEKFSEDTLRRVDKLWTDWLIAAWRKQEYLNAIKEAGFRTIAVLAEGTFPMAQASDILKGKILSLQIQGIK
jgi:arsenite methyltransferase